jgi:uncharacterized protein (TIGR02145 family)
MQLLTKANKIIRYGNFIVTLGAGPGSTKYIKVDGNFVHYNEKAISLGSVDLQLKSFLERVTLDTGFTNSGQFTRDAIKFYKQEGLYDNTLLLFIPESGVKLRISGDNKFVTKGYDVTGQNDLTQTTEADQLYLSGNIAPNERYVVKQIKGTDNKKLIHDSVSVVGDYVICKVVASEVGGKINITHTEGTGGTFTEVSENGKLYYYRIQDGAMSPAQVLAEYDFLRSYFPEVESVKIGDQTWSTSNSEVVTTPMGNIIPEVQDNVDWVNMQNIYDAAIAGGDSIEVATRKAAAWRYPSNTPNTGAIYGKLYNWWAAKLLQYDIDAYNLANPLTPLEWGVPTDAEMISLKSYLGEEAGKKMKHETDEFWTNANGDNETGFTALPSGYYDAAGDLQFFETMTGFWTTDNKSATEGKVAQLHNDLDILIL